MVTGPAMDEREDRLGVDRHLGLCACEAGPREDLLVVLDDPVVDADDRAVPDRVVVGADPRMALRVVAHMDENLVRDCRYGNVVEDGARSGALLVHGHAARGVAVRVADCICATLGDSCKERLRAERTIDLGSMVDAVSRDAAHRVTS